MNESDIFESDSSADIQSFEHFEVFTYSLETLRRIPSIPISSVFISENPRRRQQAYEVNVDQKFNFVRRQGFRTELTNGRFFFVDACDENGDSFTLAVCPEYIWLQSGFWLNVLLIEWSIEKDEEIFNIISHSLSSMSEYFGWVLRGLIPAQSQQGTSLDDAILFMDQSHQMQIAIQADSRVLDQCELRVRQYSVPYQKNCLWLGAKINFKMVVKLDPIKSFFTVPEIVAINIGDLLPLKQNWQEATVARLSAYVMCRSIQGNKKWRRKIFLRIDSEDARMEFGRDEWELDNEVSERESILSANNVDGFRVGENGPDAVELDILVGTTTISFNELCNIQEGSLIEISGNTLPIVKMNVAGETVLEGELVRLGDQLMVQVTKKVA